MIPLQRHRSILFNGNELHCAFMVSSVAVFKAIFGRILSLYDSKINTDLSVIYNRGALARQFRRSFCFGVNVNVLV